jgi:endonuclease G
MQMKTISKAMMIHLSSFLLTLLSILIIIWPADATTIDDLALGLPSQHDTIVHHLGYALGYREADEQAAWVLYCLSADEVLAKVGHRRDNFRPDPAVPTGSATLADYRGSGLDRGHLAPAADMAWSQEAMDESFFMSNMSPQPPAFNRGIWKELEDQVRSFAVAAGELWVTTGPLLEEGLPRIGASGVSVPRAFYKVLLVLEPRPRELAFLLPADAGPAPLERFVLTVDELERRSGLDFYPALPDSLERRLEATVSTRGWDFGPALAATPAGERLAAAVQCRGITKKGLRCKRLTRSSSGLCWQHER